MRRLDKNFSLSHGDARSRRVSPRGARRHGCGCMANSWCEAPCTHGDAATLPLAPLGDRRLLGNCHSRLALILVVLFAGSCHLAFALTPEESLRKADRLEKEGALRDAQSIYEEFLGTHKTHVQANDVRYKLALCFDKMGDIERAIKELNTVIEQSRGKSFKHRSDALMHLAKLYKVIHKRPQMITVLKQLIDGGPSLYEEDAYDMCASALAVEGRTDEAAAMFSILKRKSSPDKAKEAAFKLAVLWMKAGKIDLASRAVEEFVGEYGTDDRAPELMMEVARTFFQQKMYARTKAVCEQVKTRYGRSRSATEASYLVALCFKEAGRPDAAIVALKRLAALQKTDNPALAGEAAYMIGNIQEKDLKDMESAVESYRQATQLVTGNDARSREIRTYCYLQTAEHLFRKEEWTGALDMYLKLQQMATEINVTPRIMTCKAKLGQEADMKVSLDTKEEEQFVLTRIKENAGTLMAAELDIMLLDRRLTAMRSSAKSWADHLEPLFKDYEALLKKYSLKVLKKADLDTYIYMQMGHCCLAAVPATAPPGTKVAADCGRAIESFEKALAANAKTINAVVILEAIAYAAERMEDRAKTFDAYKRLYDATGIADLEKRKKAGTDSSTRRDPIEYLAQMVQLAGTDAYVTETIARIKRVVSWDPKSDAARKAQFQLAEVYFVARKYSTAVREFRAYVKRFGPAQDKDGNITGAKTPQGTPEQVREWYEAGLRIAHCWFAQGNDPEMLRAYRWVAYNQPASPHGAEAWYYTAAGLPEQNEADKERKAELLWRNIANRSMDFGSPDYLKQYHAWIQASRSSLVIQPRQAEFVSAGLLRAAQLYMDLNKYEIAADILREYLRCRTSDRNKRAVPMDGAISARYALGRCLVHVEAYEEMGNLFRPYIDAFRDDRFRASALLLLGHYGREGGLDNDSAEALAALLDEYGRKNQLDPDGKPIPVPEEDRLRKGSKWNGICLVPPETWDVGKVRFSLGHLYWRQEDWDRTAKTLESFLNDRTLAKSPSRSEALFMLGRSQAGLKNYGRSTEALWKLVESYPDFKGTEEAYVDLIRASYTLKDYNQVKRAHEAFVKRLEQSQWRPYMDLYLALSLVEQETTSREGITKLKDLSTADTFEDVKADAYYHVGKFLMRGTTQKHQAAALSQLRHSIDLYPTEKSLLAGAKCAFALRDTERARGYLERAVRDFPDGDPETLREADKLLTKVIELKK